MSRESKRLRKSSTSCWILAMYKYSEWKVQFSTIFSCFPFCQVVHCRSTSYLRRHSNLKHLLVVYFISSISAKKILKSIHVCQSYSKTKVGRFLKHGVITKLSKWIILMQNSGLSALY